MDTRSKIFFLSLAALFLFASFLSYERLIVQRAYDMYIAVPCDPTVSSCFMTSCEGYDPTELCYENYEIVRKKAYDIPDSCTILDPEKCPALAECPAGDDCEVIICDAETSKEEGSDCSVSQEEGMNETL